LRSYLHPDLLVVDDFCLRELAPQQAKDLFGLIGEPHRDRSMLIASSRAPQGWYPLFPNPALAGAALDRLINRSRHLVLEGVVADHYSARTGRAHLPSRPIRISIR